MGMVESQKLPLARLDTYETYNSEAAEALIVEELWNCQKLRELRWFKKRCFFLADFMLCYNSDTFQIRGKRLSEKPCQVRTMS